MVQMNLSRESRHVAVHGLPENLTIDKISSFFSIYGRVQKIDKNAADKSIIVSFTDVRSAQKAYQGVHKIDNSIEFSINFYEPDSSLKTGPAPIPNPLSTLNTPTTTFRINSNTKQPKENPANVFNIAIHKNTIKRLTRDSQALRASKELSEATTSSPSTSSSTPNTVSHHQSITVLPSTSSSSSTLPSSSSSSVLQAIIVEKLPQRSDTTLKEHVRDQLKRYGSKLTEVVIDLDADSNKRAVVWFQKIDHEKVLADQNINILGQRVRLRVAPFTSATSSQPILDPRCAPASTSSSTPSSSSTTQSPVIGSGSGIGHSTMLHSSASSSYSRRGGSSMSGTSLSEEVDVFNPKASRTLYVGGLETKVPQEVLRKRFQKFGEILDVDVKNGDSPSPFAFLQFADIDSAVRAVNAHLTANKKGRPNFGRSTPTNKLWVGHLPENAPVDYITQKLRTLSDTFAEVIVDMRERQAIVIFSQAESATPAYNRIRSNQPKPFIFKLPDGDHRVAADYCSDRLHDYFIDRKHQSTSSSANTNNAAVDPIRPPPPFPALAPSTSSAAPSSSNEPLLAPPPDPPSNMPTFIAAAVPRQRDRGSRTPLSSQQQMQPQPHYQQQQPQPFPRRRSRSRDRDRDRQSTPRHYQQSNSGGSRRYEQRSSEKRRDRSSKKRSRTSSTSSSSSTNSSTASSSSSSSRSPSRRRDSRSPVSRRKHDSSQRSRRSRSRTRTRDRRDSSASTSSRPTNNAAASRKPSSPPAKSLHQRASGFFSSSDGPLAPPPAPPPIIGVTSQTPGTSQQQTSTAAHQILSPNKVATPAPLLSPRTSNSSKIQFNINNPPRALQHQQQPQQQQQQPVAKRPSLDANATASVMTLGSSATTTTRAPAKPATIPLEPLYRRDENTLLKDGPTDPRSHRRTPITLVPYSRQIDKITPWVRGCSPLNRSSMENGTPSRNNSTGNAPNSRLTEKRHSDSGPSLPAPSSLSNADHRKPAPVSVVHRTSASTSTSSTDRPLLQHRNNEKRPYDYGNNHQQQQPQQSQSHQKSTLVLTPRLSDDEYVVEDDDDDQLGEYPPPPPSSLDMLCQPMKGFDNSFFKKKIEIFGERLHKTSTPTTPATPATPFQHVAPSTSSILPAPSTSFHQQQSQTVAPSVPQYHPLHPISIGAAAAAAAQHHQPLPSTSGLLLSQQNSQDSTTSETGFQGGSPKRFGIKKMSGGSGDMDDIRARLSHLERQRHVNEFADFVPSAAPLTRPRGSFESTKNEPTPTPLPLPPPPLSISIPPPSTSSLIQQVPQPLASTHSTSSQQPLPSPVSTSRHGSMSSTQKPASIVRTASMSYPPPPIGVITNIVIAQEPPPSSSTSMASPILSAPPPPPYIPKPTPPRRDSESSSRTPLMSPPVVASTSKPKGSETPKPYAPAANANITINTQAAAPPKQVRRHDSVSGRPVPTTPAPQGIQNRSMSESVHPKTPVGAEVISKMLNPTQPNTWGLSFKKNSNTAAAPGATPGPSTAQVVQKPVSSAIPFVKEKSHKEKKEKKKEKEREKEKQREKEEKQRRKEKEKRREEKQRQKEKEKEEKQRRKEKEKKQQQQQMKRRESSDSEEVSDEESDEESGKALTQLEQDHRLAVLLSEGTIIEKVKSRRNKVEKRKNESLEKIRQKKNSGAQSTRRILLDSSDGSAGDDNDSEASMVRESENERADARKDDSDDDDEEETRRRIEKAKKKEKKQKKMSMDDVYGATSDDEKKKKKKKEREEKKKRKRRMEEVKDDDEDEDDDDEKDDRDVVKKRKKKKMRKESADNDEEINRFMEKFHKKNAKRRHTTTSPTPSTSSQPSDAYSNPAPNTDATTKPPPSKRPAPTPHSLADLEDVSDATTATNEDTVKNNEADTTSTPISSPAAQHVTKTTTTVPTGPPAMISPRQRYRTSSTASTSSTVGGGAEKLVSPITPKTSISSIELEEAQKTTRLLATKASVKSFDSSLVQETPLVVAPSATEAPAPEHPARPPSSADSSSSSNSDVSDSSDSEEADDAINKIEAELCKVSPGQTSSPAPAPAQNLEADDATATMMSEDQEAEPVPEPEPEPRMSIFDEDDDVEPQYPSHDFIEKSANLSIDADEPESSSSSMNRPRASMSPPSRAGKDDIPDEQILEEIYCEEPVVDDDEMRDERPTPQPTSETPTKMGDYEDEQEPLRIAPTPTPPLARVEVELPPRPASVVMAPRPPSNPMIAYNNLQQQQIAQQQLAAPSPAPTTIVITDPQISTLQFIQQRNKLLAEAEAARAAQVVEQSTMPSALSSSASPAPVVASSTAQLFSPKVVTNGNRPVPTTSATPAVTVPSPVAATVSQSIKVSVPTTVPVSTTVLSHQSTPTTSAIRANSVYPPAFLSQQSTPTAPSTVPTTIAHMPDPVVTSAMLIHQAAVLQYIEMQAKTVRLAKEKEEKDKAAAAAAARLEEKRRKEAKEKKEREEMERKKQILLQQQQQQLAANYQLAHQLQAQVLRQFPQFNVNERQIAQLAQHLAAVTAAAQLPVTTAAATTSTPFQPQVAAPAPAPASLQIAAPVQAPAPVQIQAPIQVAAPVQVPVQVPVSVQAPAPVHVATSIPVQAPAPVQIPTPTPSPITNGGAPMEPEKPPTPATAEILTNGTHASPPQQNGHYVLKNLPATGLGRCQLNPIPTNVKFLDWYPLSWTGRVTMKSSDTPLSLHLISGSREYLQTVLGDPDVAPQLQRKEIRINQRLRLRTEKGTNQIERLLSTEDFCCCIGVPAGLGRDEVVTSREVLKTNFIDYFTDKNIAGIGTLMAENDKQDQPCRVHLFAPADMVDGYIKKLAPNLHDRLNGNSLTYVLVIFGTQDKVDPPTTETAAAVAATA